MLTLRRWLALSSFFELNLCSCFRDSDIFLSFRFFFSLSVENVRVWFEWSEARIYTARGGWRPLVGANDARRWLVHFKHAARDSLNSKGVNKFVWPNKWFDFSLFVRVPSWLLKFYIFRNNDFSYIWFFFEFWERCWTWVNHEKKSVKVGSSIQFATVFNDDQVLGGATLGSILLHQAHHFHTFEEYFKIQNWEKKFYLLTHGQRQRVSNQANGSLQCTERTEHCLCYILKQKLKKKQEKVKTCEPFVFGPALAIERMPGPVCLSLKFSSANFSP